MKIVFKTIWLICLIIVGNSETEVIIDNIPNKLNGNIEIIGGMPAERTVSFISSIQVKNNNKWQHFCGGSLIDNQWIMTAAHCTQYINTSKRYRVVIGRYNLSKRNKREAIRYLADIKIHPNYSYTNGKEHDIALIKLRSKVNYIHNIELTSTIIYPETLRVVGWGRTSVDNFSYSKILMQVDVPVVPNKVCKSEYPEITSNMMCAGNTTSDSCQGDSGGPLFSFFNNGTAYRQIGIVSYGHGCANPYGVYTNIYSYISWVYEIIGKFSKIN
jgi:secreted trypsin-like serine protease